MTRTARISAPHAVHHIIARFVNREHRFRANEERAEYLRRLAAALGTCDWVVFGYALMSSHVHLVCRAGTSPSDHLIRPVHSGFAQSLNRTQGRLGPLFAERHTTIVLPDERAGHLLAYVHNNPVRGGVVEDAAMSTWTSHRAYLGLDGSPAWLAIDDGLRLCGLRASVAGRAAFGRLVTERRGMARDEVLSGDAPAALRQARRAAGAPVEVAAGVVTLEEPPRRRHEVLAAAESPVRPRWDGRASTVILAAAAMVGVSAERVCSRFRGRRCVAARRLALLVWTSALGRPQKEMALALGIGPSAACQLLRENDAALTSLAGHAEMLAALCWAPTNATSISPDGPSRP